MVDVKHDDVHPGLTGTGSRRYIAALDGVRAIAVLGVLCYHVSPSALPGGFVGVDVFFVLSGFLIASIIQQDICGGCFSFSEFYLRRIQRLLPNTLVVILTVILLWVWLLPGQAAKQTARHGLWTVLNLSNFYSWRYLGGYWGNAAEWAPLTHTWSLGVEEQFYLLFPGLFFLLIRWAPKRVVIWLMVLGLLSLGACIFGSSKHAAATFYLLPTRFWELIMGAILASIPLARESAGTKSSPRSGGTATTFAAWIGLVLVLGSFALINGRYRFPGLIDLAPTIGTGLIILSVLSEAETMVSGLLTIPIMRRIGKLSYSIYLWHWPFITLGKIEANYHGWPLLAGSIGGALIGALLSWAAFVLVEQPLRKRELRTSWRLPVVAAGFGVVLLCCCFVMSRRPVADKYHQFDTPTFHGLEYSAGRIAKGAIAESTRYYDVDFPAESSRTNDLWRTGGILHLYGGSPPRIVVLGSSHALMYSRLIDDISRSRKISVAFLGMDYATPAFFESTTNPNFTSSLEARDFDDTRRKWLQIWRPDEVFVIDRWDNVAKDAPHFNEQLRSFLKEVCPLASRVIFVCQVPALDVGDEVNLREFVTARRSQSLPILEPDPNEKLRKLSVASAMAARNEFPNLQVLRADLPFYLENGSVRYSEGRRFFYADRDHLTDTGTEFVRNLFENVIAQIPPSAK